MTQFSQLHLSSLHLVLTIRVLSLKVHLTTEEPGAHFEFSRFEEQRRQDGCSLSSGWSKRLLTHQEVLADAGQTKEETFQEQTEGQTQTDLLDIIQTPGRGDSQTQELGLDLNDPTVRLQTEITVFSKDACLLRQDPGRCRDYTTKWFFDIVQNKCSQFWYGGCEGNANRFQTREECEKLCLTQTR
ncbi:hypothetical protein XENORESO_007519 [Xenotaenia resolanae]|uniref:BPTI/Kunitz inhibitor domain-containing protein n=1 Tax=Xenotaenia resolanae TaxID=208358 RepID=A0ABV0VPH0_9TELE